VDRGQNIVVVAAPGVAGGDLLTQVHPDIVGTLCASGAGTERPAGMASETNLCVVLAFSKKNTNDRIKYIIRRLTPTECERAMAFPDDWTRYGHDGKEMSDSARYRMCGNSVVVNVLAYIFQNIAEKLMGGALRDMSAAVCMERTNRNESMPMV
jgi:DNA (cytosine-5)-methyltransferase 1